MQRDHQGAQVVIAGPAALLAVAIPGPLGLVDRADGVEGDPLGVVGIGGEVLEDVGEVAGELALGSGLEVGRSSLGSAARVAGARQTPVGDQNCGTPVTSRAEPALIGLSYCLPTSNVSVRQGL